MANFFSDNEDLQFYIDKWVDWKKLIELTEFKLGSDDGFKTEQEAIDFYKDILNLLVEFSANEIAPRAAKIDEQFQAKLREIGGSIAAFEGQFVTQRNRILGLG